MRASLLALISLPAAVMLLSCSKDSKKGDKSEVAASGDDGAADGGDKKNEEVYVSANYTTFSYSLTNNGLTSFTVSPTRAKSIADDLDAKTANPSGKDRKDLIALMAAKRLANEGVVPVFKVAKKLMVVEVKEDIRREMPEVAMLEMALASIHSKQIPMAEHWLGKLMRTKNPKTKAAALTAKGMIAVLDGRLPEAVDFWKQAIQAKSDYQPARLNIAFYALKFGDFKTAKSMFSGMDQDWFIQTGIMQADRLADNPKEASDLCNSILEKKPNYKPALFSCALNEYQGGGNLAKARSMLEKVAKAGGGPSSIDEKVYLALGRIEKDLMVQQQREAAAKAKANAPAPGPGAKPGPPQGAPANPPGPNGGSAPAAGATPAADTGQ